MIKAQLKTLEAISDPNGRGVDEIIYHTGGRQRNGCFSGHRGYDNLYKVEVAILSPCGIYQLTDVMGCLGVVEGKVDHMKDKNIKEVDLNQKKARQSRKQKTTSQRVHTVCHRGT